MPTLSTTSIYKKTETHRVRMTAIGDRLDYSGNPKSLAVSILDAKININVDISNTKKGAWYIGIDIKNFYLGTLMKYYQYLHVHHTLIPDEIMDEY